MSSDRKKVIVRLLSGVFLPGYVSPSAFLKAQSPVSLDEPGTRLLDILDLGGHSPPLPLEEVKLICFVRDFNRDDSSNPERLTRRAFLSRPRSQGLWLRITFPAGDLLEGVAPQTLALFDSLLDDRGIFLTPPDERSNTHRIYVPRTAMAAVELLAVINAPSRRTRHQPATPPEDQPTLFPR